MKDFGTVKLMRSAGLLAAVLWSGCEELDEEPHTYTNDEALWEQLVDEGVAEHCDGEDQAAVLPDDLVTTSQELTSTGTGFYFPVDGTISGDANWLACGSSYYSGVRHIGADLIRSIGTRVYAVAAGTVISRSGPTASSGWGPGLYALAIRHESTAGSFVAVYGHINTTLVNGAVVTAGQQIGTVGDYDVSSDHLHFGIRPGTTVPSSGWGRIADASCSAPSNTNGFVAPLSFLRNNRALGSDTTAPTVSISSPASGATLSRGVSYTLQWSASDSGGLSRVSVDLISGSATSCVGAASLSSIVADRTYTSSTSWTVPTSIALGSYKLKVAVRDPAGNWGCTMRSVSISGGTSSWSPIAVNTTYTSSVAAGAERRYSFPRVNGRTYTITLTPTSGDPDLYTSQYSSLSRSSYQCLSSNGTGAVDTCSFTATSSGTNYIIVHGFTAAGFRLVVSQR